MSEAEFVPGPDNNWGNPPTKEMLANHTLSSRIIANHNTPRAILGPTELDILREFVADPSASNQSRILEARGMLDADGASQSELGRAASSQGSLAGYVVARYGKIDGNQNTFHEHEIKALREWFESGGGK